MDEKEKTVATPYMGFNLGATKIRQDWKGKPTRHIFESPLVRLMKDHGYQDVYEAGAELPATGRIPAKSVVIYRYYDQVSEEMSGDDAERPDIEGGHDLDALEDNALTSSCHMGE